MRFTRRHLLVSALAAAAVLGFLDFEWLDTYRYSIASPDFFVYYFASQIGQAHGWTAMYDPSLSVPATTRLVGRPLPYLNPPELAWLVMPLSWLPYAVAEWIWRAILVAALAVTGYLAAPGSPRSRIGHGLAAALLLPVFISIMFGQVSLIMTAALALTWWLIRRGQPWLAGLALAAIFLKPQAAFMVPLALLLAGYWRVLVSWLAGTLLLAVVAFLAVGTSVFQMVAESVALVHGVAGPVQISLERQVPPPIAVVGIVLTLALASVIIIRTRGQGPSIPMAAGIVVSVMVSPYINFYDLSAVLLAGWFVLSAPAPSWQRALTFAMYVPLYLAPAWPLLALIYVAGWLMSLTAIQEQNGHADDADTRAHLAA